MNDALFSLMQLPAAFKSLKHHGAGRFHHFCVLGGGGGGCGGGSGNTTKEKAKTTGSSLAKHWCFILPKVLCHLLWNLSAGTWALISAPAEALCAFSPPLQSSNHAKQPSSQATKPHINNSMLPDKVSQDVHLWPLVY